MCVCVCVCVCTHALLFPHDRKGSKLECQAPFIWILSYYSSVSKTVFILIVYLRRRISQKSDSLFLKLKCAGQSQRLLLRHRFWFCSIGARPESALLTSSQVLPGPLAQATLWAGRKGLPGQAHASGQKRLHQASVLLCVASALCCHTPTPG